MRSLNYPHGLCHCVGEDRTGRREVLPVVISLTALPDVSTFQRKSCWAQANSSFCFCILYGWWPGRASSSIAQENTSQLSAHPESHSPFSLGRETLLLAVTWFPTKNTKWLERCEGRQRGSAHCISNV